MISLLAFLSVYFLIRSRYVGDKNLKAIYQLAVIFFALAMTILLVLK